MFLTQENFAAYLFNNNSFVDILIAYTKLKIKGKVHCLKKPASHLLELSVQWFTLNSPKCFGSNFALRARSRRLAAAVMFDLYWGFVSVF